MFAADDTKPNLHEIPSVPCGVLGHNRCPRVRQGRDVAAPVLTGVQGTPGVPWGQAVSDDPLLDSPHRQNILVVPTGECWSGAAVMDILGTHPGSREKKGVLARNI